MPKLFARLLKLPRYKLYALPEGISTLTTQNTAILVTYAYMYFEFQLIQTQIRIPL